MKGDFFIYTSSGMNNYYLLFLLLLLLGCQTEKTVVNQYPRWVGDISADPALDDPEFQLCHGDSMVMQYFNIGMGLQYAGEKLALEKEIYSSYTDSMVSKESGLIRIRFIVNCQGKTGRFRLIGMNSNYQEREFDTSITKQLLEITRSLNSWKVLSYKDQPQDYYQYLIFKMKDGRIEEVLP
mgnify:CR=1 FL=1